MQVNPQKAARVNAIDAIRGFCLINIFLNHITIGLFQHMSPSRVFFFDSADAFVLLAGISCSFAYGGRPSTPSAMTFAQPMWRRSLALYLTNAALAFVSVCVLLSFEAVVSGSSFTDRPDALIAEHGAGTYIWHIVTLQQDVGYTVVLRLYVALMLIAPLYVWLARVRVWLPLVPAAAIWVLAGSLGLTEYNSLTGIERSMTLLPWNFIFAAGVSLGATIRAGQQLNPRVIPVALAALILFAGPICFVFLTRYSPDVLTWVNMRNDHFWTGASKSLQSPLRVAGLFAATYLIIALRKAPVVRMVHEVGYTNPLACLGRKSLEVFAVGAALALVFERVLWAAHQSGWAEPGSLAAIACEVVICVSAVWIMLQTARSDRFSVKRVESWILDRVGARPPAIRTLSDKA